MPDDTRYGFARDAWETAKRQANALIEQRARVRRTLTYAELCREVTAIALKPRSWAIMAFLNEICTEADAKHGIMLATLVVRADTGLPGAGYFRHAERLGRDVSDREAYWRSEAERVWAVYAQEGGANA
jgi:methyl coenzyme M reductase subunit C